MAPVSNTATLSSSEPCAIPPHPAWSRVIARGHSWYPHCPNVPLSESKPCSAFCSAFWAETKCYTCRARWNTRLATLLRWRALISPGGIPLRAFGCQVIFAITPEAPTSQSRATSKSIQSPPIAFRLIPAAIGETISPFLTRLLFPIFLRRARLLPLIAHWGAHPPPSVIDTS